MPVLCQLPPLLLLLWPIGRLAERVSQQQTESATDLHISFGKLRIVSDVHVSNCRTSDECTDKLISLFRATVTPGNPYSANVKALVLLGDIFETWAIPMHLVDFTLEHRARKTKNVDTTLGHILRPKVPEILRFIEEIAQKVPTYIIRGNHDYET
ncbi:unnamed protein product [Vitrella brassicaformis CCMP3155]|uniref:Calcineurin-like phosphoesterase domain-containing protein n=1 Tax=Vitrella brassicaformis (strain CCMP3155) TaxID=1169540 RepID=A0A0G4GAZ0_VITBC|nr:unnamed protein product [Vitrella brassicaformis CCMP3155]|eukprot:CEM25981.1 unnamed protein product [Vitrella brassicaformis CCMP3155]